MHSHRTTRSPRSQRSPFQSPRAFTLAEVALAMAIFSFALLSMLGMLSVGLKFSRKANYQTAAANLLSSIAADIQASTVETTNDKDTYTSPIIGIKIARDKATDALSIVNPTGQEMVLTDGGIDTFSLSKNAPGIQKRFRVRFAPPAPNTDAVQVRISWPAGAIGTSTPPPMEGWIDSLVALPIALSLP